jgi:hypothetical protein
MHSIYSETRYTIIFIAKYAGKILFEDKDIHIWEDVNMHLRDISHEDVKWITAFK